MTEDPATYRTTPAFARDVAAMRRHDRLITQFPEVAAELDRLRGLNADLLDALKTLLGDTADSDYLGAAEQRAKARAAIAKAEGKGTD